MQERAEFGALSSTDRRLVLCKFGKHCHLERFREEGLLHFEPQQAFARKGGDPVRSDAFEGADRAYQPEALARLTISAPGSSNIALGPEDLEGPLLVGMGGARRHTCSFFGWTNLSVVPTPDPRMLGFGGSVLIVTSARELVQRTQRAADARGLGLEYGPVEYFERLRISGEVGAFRKPSEFSYQCEFRFVLTGAGQEPFELSLGSIVDISTSVFAAVEFNRLVEICEPAPST